MIDTLGHSATHSVPAGASSAMAGCAARAGCTVDFPSLLAEFETEAGLQPDVGQALDPSALSDGGDIAPSDLPLPTAPLSPAAQQVDPICAELLRMGENVQTFAPEPQPGTVEPDFPDLADSETLSALSYEMTLEPPALAQADDLPAPEEMSDPMIDIPESPVMEQGADSPERTQAVQVMPAPIAVLADPNATLASSVPLASEVPKATINLGDLVDTRSAALSPVSAPVADALTSSATPPVAATETTPRQAVTPVDMSSALPFADGQGDVADLTAAPASSPSSNVAPVSNAPTAAAAVAPLPVSAPVPMTSPNWPAAVVSGPVVAMLDAANSSMVLDIAPEELGKLTISLSVQGDVATVRFLTETPEAARILVDAERHLATELARFGMSLAGHEATSDRRQSGARGGARKPLGPEAAIGADLAPPRAVSVRLVNLLA